MSTTEIHDCSHAPTGPARRLIRAARNSGVAFLCGLAGALTGFGVFCIVVAVAVLIARFAGGEWWERIPLAYGVCLLLLFFGSVLAEYRRQPPRSGGKA